MRTCIWKTSFSSSCTIVAWLIQHLRRSTFRILMHIKCITCFDCQVVFVFAMNVIMMVFRQTVTGINFVVWIQSRMIQSILLIGSSGCVFSYSKCFSISAVKYYVRLDCKMQFPFTLQHLLRMKKIPFS